MKKLLVFLSMFYACQATAANLTDTLGAECGIILLNSDNNKFENLDKCLNLYGKIGGNYDELNKRFYRAKVLYDVAVWDYISSTDYSKNSSTEGTKLLIDLSKDDFYNNLQLSSDEMYMKYKNQYENLDSTKKDTLAYKRTVKDYEFVKKWYETDLEVENNKSEVNKKTEEGFFSWFK